MPTTDPPPLTAKQQAFVREYLVDLNASAAARRAGYSQRTADRTGHENLKKPVVAAAIQVALAERAERTELTQEFVIEGLRGIALDDEQPAAPRVRAYELLGKHRGMFVDRVDHTTGGQALPTAINVYLPSNGRDDLPRLEEGEIGK